MKNLKILLVLVILSSCASNHNVVQNGFLQKRKYKKGYHLSFKKKAKKDKIESIQAEKVFKNKKRKEVSEFVAAKEVELKKEKAPVVEAPLVASLEMSDYEVKSLLEKAVLLSDSTNTSVENRDEDETVYVKKWDIITLLSVGLGAGLYALLFSLYAAIDGGGVFLIVGSVVFVLALAAIVYGLILLDRRFLSEKRKQAKVQRAETRKYNEEAKKKEKEKEEANLEEGVNNGTISEKEKKRLAIRSKKWYGARILSYVFTTLTLVVPVFVFPAAVFTIMVLNIERKNEKNWVRISAIFRLVFLLLFAIIGFGVAANILNSLGVINLPSS